MRLVMLGTGSFAEPTFEAILGSSHAVVGLVTQPDRPTGKERGSTRQARRGLKELAQERGVAVLQPESINTPEGVGSLKLLEPDLLVVAAYGQILSRDALGVASRGGINVHASLLPKYRGAAPINWAIYHGETISGVTIIRMSAALDAGDILAQKQTAVGAEETAGELEARLGPMGARLALGVIEQIGQGTAKGIPQDKTQATKAPKLTKEHGLIDWNRTAREVCNQVRAMQPWPTAYTFLYRPKQPPLRLIILRARIAADVTVNQRDPTAGRLRADPSGKQLWVETGAGDTVEILELQPAGKRRMTAADFLRGYPRQPEWRVGGETG